MNLEVIILMTILSTLTRTTEATNINLNSHESSICDDVCLTPGCVSAAANIIEKMDEKFDPCDDFFAFRYNKIYFG